MYLEILNCVLVLLNQVKLETLTNSKKHCYKIQTQDYFSNSRILLCKIIVYVRFF